MKIRLSIAILITLVVAAATYSSQEESRAAGGQVPPGHSYETYVEGISTPWYEFKVYIDETYRDDGIPLLVGKTWVAGAEEQFRGVPLFLSSKEEAQHWWGDRSRMDLSQHWSFHDSGGDHRWVYNGPEQTIIARFGIVNVEGGDLIGGELATRNSATARTISPITGDVHVNPPPSDVNQETGNCPNTPEEVSQVFNGHFPPSSFNGPVEDGGFVYSGDPVSFTVTEGVTVVSPHGTFTSGQTVSETNTFTIYFNCS